MYIYTKSSNIFNLFTTCITSPQTFLTQDFFCSRFVLLRTRTLKLTKHHHNLRIRATEQYKLRTEKQSATCTY